MMRLVTLQPDLRGKINTPLSEADNAVEHRCKALGGAAGSTTQDSVEAGGASALFARDPRTSRLGTATPTARDFVRSGNVSLPFVPHLFGLDIGGFCGDSSLLIGLDPAGAAVPLGCTVELYGYDATRAIPLVRKTGTTASPGVVGVVRGVIEDDVKRSYRGLSGTGNLYAVQLFGSCLAWVKRATTPATTELAAGDKLYFDGTNAEGALVRDATSTLFAYYLGGDLGAADNSPLDAETYTLSWVYVPLGRGGSAPTFAIKWGDLATLPNPLPDPPGLQEYPVNNQTLDLNRLPRGEFIYVSELRAPTTQETADIATAVAQAAAKVPPVTVPTETPTYLLVMAHTCVRISTTTTTTTTTTGG